MADETDSLLLAAEGDHDRSGRAGRSLGRVTCRLQLLGRVALVLAAVKIVAQSRCAMRSMSQAGRVRASAGWELHRRDLASQNDDALDLITASSRCETLMQLRTFVLEAVWHCSKPEPTDSRTVRARRPPRGSSLVPERRAHTTHRREAVLVINGCVRYLDVFKCLLDGPARQRVLVPGEVRIRSGSKKDLVEIFNPTPT